MTCCGFGGVSEVVGVRVSDVVEFSEVCCIVVCSVSGVLVLMVLLELLVLWFRCCQGCC